MTQPLGESRYLEDWSEAFEKPELLRSAPLGALFAPLYQKLRELQNPGRCKDASFLVVGYTSPLVFGAQIKALSVLFYFAIVTGRIFVVDDVFLSSGRWDVKVEQGMNACFVHCRFSAQLVRNLEIALTNTTSRSNLISFANPKRPYVVFYTMKKFRNLFIV